MPLLVDADSQAVLDHVAARDRPPAHELTPAQARLRRILPQSTGPEVFGVEDRSIPGPGRPLRVRVYTPSEGGPFPILVWAHGGGWVQGSMEGDDATCRRLARGAGCAVLSVDYRLAPENRFPAALEDVHAAAVWAREHALLIHGDGGRIAVGGVSAGGNLAAATALLARDRGGPSLVFQLLVCPITDRNFDTDSYLECGNAFRPQRDTMMWFWDHYLNEDSEARNPLAAPLQAPDLAGLPAGHVVVAECDPLRDEGEAYARRLREAGIPVTCVRYPNTIHYVFHLPDRIEKGALAVAEACAALRRAFAEPSR